MTVVEQHNDDFEELPQGERMWHHDRVAAQRKRLLAAGYLPLPINGKIPPIPGWQDIVATAAIIDRWTNQWPDSVNTGVLTRTTPAIDIDIMHPEAGAGAVRGTRLSPSALRQGTKTRASFSHR